MRSAVGIAVPAPLHLDDDRQHEHAAKLDRQRLEQRHRPRVLLALDLLLRVGQQAAQHLRGAGHQPACARDGLHVGRLARRQLLDRHRAAAHEEVVEQLRPAQPEPCIQHLDAQRRLAAQRDQRALRQHVVVGEDELAAAPQDAMRLPAAVHLGRHVR